MNRRAFVGWSLAAAGLVFAPKYGRWHRQGSGLLVPDGEYVEFILNGRVYERQRRKAGDNHFVMTEPGGKVYARTGGRIIRTGWFPDGIQMRQLDTLTVHWGGLDY